MPTNEMTYTTLSLLHSKAAEAWKQDNYHTEECVVVKCPYTSGFQKVHGNVYCEKLLHQNEKTKTNKKHQL